MGRLTIAIIHSAFDDLHGSGVSDVGKIPSNKIRLGLLVGAHRSKAFSSPCTWKRRWWRWEFDGWKVGIFFSFFKSWPGLIPQNGGRSRFYPRKMVTFKWVLWRGHDLKNLVVFFLQGSLNYLAANIFQVTLKEFPYTSSLFGLVI